ncbi:MAG: PLP-dependent aminotransferase family protein [Terrisporobacter othiniensis]|uniref:aminotransferase-like domain-containing protein n=1 Tax=Terrisporobacter othiniensis TaxID=1577792 RepID=UPI00290D8DD5|nr:PLP-dependent aminotransferase family protein [Terrisporobacter othiniensis]MDU6983167.1 PLP-dependent aminotransferase family protein [Terrisporobacter othiniensis]
MKYAQRMNMVKASAIRASQKKIAAKVASGGSVISFAAGLPDPNLFPLDEITDVTETVLKERGSFALAYGPTKGENELLELLAKRMKDEENIDTKPENIIITTGSQQGIAVSAMILLDKGDIVVTENPSYLGAINAFRPYECDFLGIDTDEEGIVTKDLDKLLSENPKVKIIYVIPTFQNPTGKTWSLQRRKDFMKVVNKYDDVIVIEDNPYGEIRFTDEPLPTLKSLDTKDKVLYLGSFSKVLCPGFRVAWMCGDKDIIDKAELLKQGIDLQSNQFSQAQVIEFLKKYDLNKHIEKIRAEYKKRCFLMLDTIKEHFPEEVNYTTPDGGMFIWVELPKEINVDDLLDKAIDAGVAYVSGESFFANNGPKNTMRLNYTTMPEEQIVEGIKILANVIKKELNYACE